MESVLQNETSKISGILKYYKQISDPIVSENPGQKTKFRIVIKRILPLQTLEWKWKKKLNKYIYHVLELRRCRTRKWYGF